MGVPRSCRQDLFCWKFVLLLHAFPYSCIRSKRMCKWVPSCTQWQLVMYSLSWTVIGQPYCLHHDVMINVTAPIESHVDNRPIKIKSRVNSRWLSRAEFCTFWLLITDPYIYICGSNGEVTNLKKCVASTNLFYLSYLGKASLTQGYYLYLVSTKFSTNKSCSALWYIWSSTVHQCAHIPGAKGIIFCTPTIPCCSLHYPTKPTHLSLTPYQTLPYPKSIFGYPKIFWISNNDLITQNRYWISKNELYGYPTMNYWYKK